MTAATENLQAPANVLPGFSQISRSWDREHSIQAAKILPGEYYVTTSDELITTVLGSCISACIRDPLTGVGGMNHFMLPGNKDTKKNKWAGVDCLETRYGIAAMENLINDVLKQGSRKERLEIKLFGGGEVLKMETTNVGKRNVQFALEFVRAEGLAVVSEDLGGPYPRKVNYFPKTGKVMVRRLRSLQTKAIIEHERKFESSLETTQQSGSIDLFD